MYKSTLFGIQGIPDAVLKLYTEPTCIFFVLEYKNIHFDTLIPPHLKQHKDQL